MKRLLLSLLYSGFAANAALAADPGNKAPDCALSPIGATAEQYHLDQFRGKVVYLDFWASWCQPCAKSFPLMNELEHDLADRGLQIIAVNMDETPDDAKAFLDQHPAHFSIVSDAGEKCVQAYDVKAMPSSYMIDRNGIIRHVHLGFRADQRDELRNMVEQLLAEKPSTGQ